MANEIDTFGRTNVPENSSGHHRAAPYLYYPASTEAARHERTQKLEYLAIIKRHARSIIFLAALGALAGVSIAYFTRPMYRARVTLDIQQFDENVLNMRPTAEPSNNSGAPAESYIQTEIKILQSDTVSRRVIEKLGAAQAAPPELPSSDIAAWSKSLANSTPAPVDRQVALPEIARELKVRTLGLTRIVEVLCDGRDPRLSAEFCNTLATEYIAQKRRGPLADHPTDRAVAEPSIGGHEKAPGQIRGGVAEGGQGLGRGVFG